MQCTREEERGLWGGSLFEGVSLVSHRHGHIRQTTAWGALPVWGPFKASAGLRSPVATSVLKGKGANFLTAASSSLCLGALWVQAKHRHSDRAVTVQFVDWSPGVLMSPPSHPIGLHSGHFSVFYFVVSRF